MDIINVESLVRDAIDKGLPDESVVRSVRARVGRLEKQGVNLDWQAAKSPHPFWFESFARDESGRKLSPKQIQGALTTDAIESIVSKVRRELASTRDLPQVFAFSENGDPGGPDRPSQGGDAEELEIGDARSSRNVTTKDGPGILFATNPCEILRHDPNDLFRELIPILWKIAGQVAQQWNLPPITRDDLVQEARERIWLKLATFKGDGWFKSWAAVVARHAMIDHAKRETDHIVRDPHVREEPTADVVDHDAVLDLHVALSRGADGRLLLLRHLVGYNEDELAALEGYGVGSRAVSMRLTRARAEFVALAA